VGEISVKTGNNARNGGKNSLNRLIRCVCGKKIGPDPRNFNQRVSLGRNDLLIRTFPNWISANIFSAYFDLGDYNEAKKWGEMTLQTRGSEIDTAPSIDLGMVCYELEQFDEAYKYFNDAYSYGKERAFKSRPKKYLEFFLNKRA